MATIHNRRVKHTSSLPKYHFTVHSSPVKDGTWARDVRATSAANSGESAAATTRRMLTSFVRATGICDRAAKTAQTAIVASQAAAAASTSGIATGESGTAAVCSATATLALMEATHYHVEAVHAQLVAVTAQIEGSFSDNGRQPTAEELAIAERVRAAVHSCAAYLATTEPARAQCEFLFFLVFELRREGIPNGIKPSR